MMDLFEGIYDYLTEHRDPRTQDWLFIKSQYSILLILISYVYLVTNLGPRYMKNRPPYDLKTFMQCYNIFQVVVNILVVYYCFDAGWYTDTWIYCVPFDYAVTPNAMKLAVITWYVFVIKIVDLIETIVFVLRKKQGQISYLHLYHHITTVLTGWLTVKYATGGMSTFFIMVNCTIHVIMYTYYFLSTCGSSVQKIVARFKQYITLLQMVQFWILIVYSLQILAPSCPVATIPGIAIICNLVMNFFLFFNFYLKSYNKTKVKGN